MKHFIAILVGAVLMATSGMAAAPVHPLTNKELKELITNAKTPDEHLRIAHHFDAMAKKYAAESKEHAEMADMYAKRPDVAESKRPTAPDTAAHCRYIAESLEKASSEAKALAMAHEQMAKH